MDLLEARLCSPSCLLSMHRVLEDCDCRCKGRWHGSLLWADADEWSGPSEVDRQAS